MAIYTTLFTATDSELTEFFPGWQLPLSTPQTVTGIDPFSWPRTHSFDLVPQKQQFQKPSSQLHM